MTCDNDVEYIRSTQTLHLAAFNDQYSYHLSLQLTFCFAIFFAFKVVFWGRNYKYHKILCEILYICNLYTTSISRSNLNFIAKSSRLKWRLWCMHTVTDDGANHDIQ